MGLRAREGTLERQQLSSRGPMEWGAGGDEDEANQHTDSRRSLYVSDLAGLTSARHACRVAVREPDPDPLQRRRAVREALEACRSLRYELSICAPRYVVEESDNSFRRLRDLRDVVADGSSRDSNEYVTGRHRYDRAYPACHA